MYNIKFDVYNGEYQLSLPSCKLFYKGGVDSATIKIFGIIESIVNSHYSEKIDRNLIETLKDELKDQIQGQGYNFEFI